MSHCERFKEKLFKFLDNELEGAAKEEVLQHLQSCSACEAFYRQMHSLKQRLHDMKPVKTPVSFQIVLRERIRREKAHRKGIGLSYPPVSRIWVPAIAVTALVLIAALFLFRSFLPFNLHESGIDMSLLVPKEGDGIRIHYVIDDIDASDFHEQYPSDSFPIALKDSLFVDDSFSTVHELYQPVRF